MKSAAAARILFWVLIASVLFFALIPGPLGDIIESDVERHYLAFLVLPAVASYGWPRLSVVLLWIAFVAFGGMIEILQLVMALGRAAEWRDWVNDIVATTISLVVSTVILRMVRPTHTA